MSENMSESILQLQLDIAVIKEKVSGIEEIRAEVKKISENYLVMQGNLAAYTDVKKRLEATEKRVNQLNNKLYWFSGVAVAFGFVFSKVWDKIFL